MVSQLSLGMALQVVILQKSEVSNQLPEYIHLETSSGQEWGRGGNVNVDT